MPILQWLTANMEHVRHVRLKTDVAMMVLELYGSKMGQSADVDRQIRRLHGAVRHSCEAAQMCWGTLGMIGLLEADACTR